MVLTDDQKALQETARRFSRERLLPDYQKREKQRVLDRALIREMGALGLLGTDIPESFGGLGMDGVTTGLIAEEVAYGDFNISGGLAGGTVGCNYQTGSWVFSVRTRSAEKPGDCAPAANRAP